MCLDLLERVHGIHASRHIITTPVIINGLTIGTYCQHSTYKDPDHNRGNKPQQKEEQKTDPHGYDQCTDGGEERGTQQGKRVDWKSGERIKLKRRWRRTKIRKKRHFWSLLKYKADVTD